jgi:hypothetical protein
MRSSSCSWITGGDVVRRISFVVVAVLMLLLVVATAAAAATMVEYG